MSMFFGFLPGTAIIIVFILLIPKILRLVHAEKTQVEIAKFELTVWFKICCMALIVVFIAILDAATGNTMANYLRRLPSLFLDRSANQQWYAFLNKYGLYADEIQIWIGEISIAIIVGSAIRSVALNVNYKLKSKLPAYIISSIFIAIGSIIGFIFLALLCAKGACQ